MLPTKLHTLTWRRVSIRAASICPIGAAFFVALAGTWSSISDTD